MEITLLKTIYFILILQITLTENAKIHEEAHLHRAAATGNREPEIDINHEGAQSLWASVNGKQHEMDSRNVPAIITETTPISSTSAHNVRRENAGFRARVSRSGMEYAAHVATHILEQQIHNINVADQKGVKDMSVGKVDYVMTNIRILSFTPPTTTVTMEPFKWSIRDVAMTLTGDWAYEYRAFSFFTVQDHGSLQVSLKLNLDTTLSLTRADTGRLHVHMDTCRCDVTHVDARFHRGWLYNLFDGVVEKDIKKTLNRQVCDETRVVINEKANEALGSVPVMVTLQDHVLLDYSLVHAPRFAPDFLDLDFAAEFSWRNAERHITVYPDPLPDISPDPDLHMVGFWLTEYTIKTLALTALQHDQLQVYITQDDAYESEKFLLQTTCVSFFKPCIGKVVSAIQERYPDSVVEANVFATEVPVISISPKGINVNISGVIEFYAAAENNDSSPHFMFATNVQILLNVTVSIQELKIVAQFSDYLIDLSLNRTEIGEVNVGYLQFLVNIFMMTSIMPRLDMIGSAGFQLPAIKDVEYLNPTLVLLQNSIYAGVDAQFNGI